MGSLKDSNYDELVKSVNEMDEIIQLSQVYDNKARPALVEITPSIILRS
jgi:hypothetical protein